MLEPPAIPEENIRNCLQADFGIDPTQITFLPLGADVNTAVYQVTACDNTLYFLKLRGRAFDEMSVRLPRFLSDKGIAQIIAPFSARSGQPWADLAPFKAALYPYVEGLNGFKVKLTEQQWAEFGSALRKIHALDVPTSISSRIRRETFSPRWREKAREFLSLVSDQEFEEPTAAKVAGLLNTKRDVICDLIDRTDDLAVTLATQTPEFVLCHSDIHAGNILIDAAGSFYIVDWDDPIMAPKERDLMYIGGAQGFISSGPQEEETLFYRGYGAVKVDPIGLAYYRYERIIEDIAAYCQELLLTGEGGEDREQSFIYLQANFLPGGTIETAYGSDKSQ